VRGGFKLGAGVLGTVAGSIGAVFDFLRMGEQESSKGKAFYFGRGAVGAIGTGLGAAAAFSYSGPFLNHAAEKLAKGSRGRVILVATAKQAGKLAARVRLLVWVARFNWIGLGLTVAEIGYLLIKDNELQNWCEQSVFRKVKVGTNWLGTPTREKHFESAQRELEELARAAQAVGVGG